jgi:phage terminase small subunit
MRELTERQQKFLEVLFEEAGGDVVQAKRLAGYSDNVRTSEVINSIKEEIMERTQLYMARNAPRAAMSLVSGMIDPTELGLRDKLNAAKDLLDRVGLVKTEKVQVEATNGLMILPPKEKDEE